MDGIALSLLLSQGGVEAWMGRERLIMVMIVALFTVPFLLGSLIARSLRLEDLSGRIGVVLMAIAMSLSPFVYEELRGRSYKDAFKMGIDLAGGTNLVYSINLREAKEQGKTVDKATIEKMVDAIKRRVNPSGTIDMTVRAVGTERIEVIVPGADRDLVEQMKAQITRLGSLEFGIVANELDHPKVIESARKIPDDQREYFADSRVLAVWRDVAEGQDVGTGGQVAYRTIKRPDKDGKEVEIQQYLIMQDSPDKAVTGKYLTSARAQSNDNGQPAVGFNFNARGAVLFSNLTGRNLPEAENGPNSGFQRRLAILLDGRVYSAPVIRSRISSSGQIDGNFTMKEVNELVAVL
ncbi:MAG: protein translocase subunit SecDF, partial [Planctomycetes bacterium]|nr:protein translocase subunit SecDF [Planctomycetota bacterium]